jgi:hypothetical protein
LGVAAALRRRHGAVPRPRRHLPDAHGKHPRSVVVARLGRPGFHRDVRQPLSREVAHPLAHVCEPVPYLDYANGTSYHEASHLFVATLWNQGSGGFGPQGVYFTTSTDFIHWSKPQLAITLNQMLRREPEGNWSYMYFSLIDPNANDASFATITDHPYLYYVRLDNNHGPYQRVLFRQRVKLDWLIRSAVGGAAH